MPDVVDLIMADHREVERLFDILKNKPEQRLLALPTVAALLIAHSRAEEAEVYPVAKAEAGEEDEVEHSQHEHAEAEQILKRLGVTDPTTSDYGKLVDELVEAVSHHVEEEESNVLPGIRERLDDKRRAELGDAFAKARAEHLGDRPGEATRDELAMQAQNLGMSGTSSMSKDELEQKVTQSEG
jgi:hemerythrin-like domain-containing protein